MIYVEVVDDVGYWEEKGKGEERCLDDGEFFLLFGIFCVWVVGC